MIDEDLSRRLSDPDCYPDPRGAVTLFQTHLSMVAVTGEHAYKLKKPLQLPFVDFSTRELRKHFCEEEVRLNSRLCPDLYLGVVPLFAGAGRPTFRHCPGADIIDYAVLMRRLPFDRMMDVLLASDAVTLADVRKIAETMATFHRRVALPGDSPEALQTAERLREFARANFDETDPFVGTLFDAGLHHILRKRNDRDFVEHLPTLQARARSGRVVDGHGDLHARNICLREPPAIYDCIEFNRDLRVQDVAAENAFLVMDLRYRGHPELAQAYLNHSIDLAHDPAQRGLLPMLVRYRAMVRAKVAAFASGEQEIAAAERESHHRSALRHLNLAAASAIEESGPCLICACGLPASGKSYVFESLARASGWLFLRSDAIRKELAGVEPGERAPESYYTEEFAARTYAEMLRRASAGLARGPVLLDANFPNPELRGLAIDCAREASARVVFVWFQSDEDTVEERMRKRATDTQEVSDAGIDVYRKLKAAFVPPAPNEGALLITCNAGGSREKQAAAIFRQILAPEP